MKSTLIIKRAEATDAQKVLEITRKSFAVYRDSIPADVSLAALIETVGDVEKDISENYVYVAETSKKTEGSIRFTLLTPDIAYIYRFGVNPASNNTGIGSGLLARAIEEIATLGAKIVALHTNSKYYKLARYYYGRGFYVHSTDTSKGYIRAFFVKELTDNGIEGLDLTLAYNR